MAINLEAVDIAVVGAGPVGLAASLLLAESGRAATLIGPAAGRDDHRTTAVLGGTVALLERMGLRDELRRAAAPLRAIRIIDGSRRIVRAPEAAFDAAEIGREAFGYNVPNSALVAALEARLVHAGVLRRHASIASAAPHPEHVVLTLDDGSELTAKLVVAADGRRSSLRSAAGITPRTWGYLQSALVANLRHEAPHHDESVEFHTENGPLTLVPLPAAADGTARSSLVWVETPERVTARLKVSADDLGAEISERTHHIFGRVTVEADGRQAFPLSGLSVNRFAAQRIALAGEAGHVFPPIGAQGLNLGYRDAEAAVRIFGGTRGDPGAAGRLAAYHRDRLADARIRTTAVDALNRSLLTGFLPAQIVRGLGLFALASVPPLRRAAMKLGLAGDRLSATGPRV